VSAIWPTTGAIPVFQGDAEAPELVGYTTLIVDYYPKVGRFMMSWQGREPDSMTFVGKATVIERQGAGGSYLAWLVIEGDPHDMPDFWPV
jgi:hypothetical protein